MPWRDPVQEMLLLHVTHPSILSQRQKTGTKEIPTCVGDVGEICFLSQKNLEKTNPNLLLINEESLVLWSALLVFWLYLFLLGST